MCHDKIYTVFYHLLLFQYVDIWYVLILIKIIEFAWQLLFTLVILMRIAFVLEWNIASSIARPTRTRFNVTIVRYI